MDATQQQPGLLGTPCAGPVHRATSPPGGDANCLKLFRVPRHLIDVPAQIRKFFEEDFIGRLTAAVRTKGQTWPVKVRQSATPGRWELVAGEQRLRAFDAAGITEIWALEVPGELSPADLVEEQLQENGLRTALRPCEEAEALDRLRELRGCTLTQLANAVQFSLTHVSRRCTLLKYPPELRARIDAGEVVENVAIEIAKVPQNDDRLALFERAAREHWTKERAIAAVSVLVKRRKAKANSVRPLNRVCLKIGQRGATVTVTTCPESQSALTTEVLRDTLEFALQEIRKALRKKVQAAALPDYFEQLKDKRAPCLGDGQTVHTSTPQNHSESSRKELGYA
jgi:ParB/RepB/Spo0J family partition protein